MTRATRISHEEYERDLDRREPMTEPEGAADARDELLVKMTHALDGAISWDDDTPTYLIDDTYIDIAERCLSAIRDHGYVIAPPPATPAPDGLRARVALAMARAIELNPKKQIEWMPAMLEEADAAIAAIAQAGRAQRTRIAALVTAVRHFVEGETDTIGYQLDQLDEVRNRYKALTRDDIASLAAAAHAQAGPGMLAVPDDERDALIEAYLSFIELGGPHMTPEQESKWRRQTKLLESLMRRLALARDGGGGEEREKPTIESDYGDYVVLRCACGAEVGFSPPADDRERECSCGRVLWLTQTTDYGYKLARDGGGGEERES